MSNTLEVMISTSRGGYDDSEREPAYNELSLAIFGRGCRIKLPPLIKPIERTVKTNAGTYVDYTQRRYGFYLFDNSHLVVAYGNASDNSSEEQAWSCFVPWSAARFIRTSYYDAAGDKIILTHWDGKKPGRGGFETFRKQRAEVDALENKTVFAFADTDGEEILATASVEEREWRLGTGIFRWLYFFRRPRIRKSLNLEFSAEVGAKKGSWKGGIVGHGIDMQPGESVRHCWARYCDDHKLTPLERSPLEISEMKLAVQRRRAAARAKYADQSNVAKAVRNV